MNIKYDKIELPKDFAFDLNEMRLPPYNNMGGYLHYHDCFEISAVMEGTGRYIIDGKKYDVEAGDIVVINNIEPHSLIVGQDGLTQKVLIFEPQLICKANCWLDYEYIKPFMERGMYFNNLIKNDSEVSFQLHHFIKLISDELDGEQEGWRLMVKSHLLAILTLLFRHFRNDIQNTRTRNKLLKLKAAIEYIEENYNQDLSLDQLAQITHFSPEYFSFFFKASAGINYKQYLNNVRINQANKLLRTTDLTITQIATHCGFNSMSNFYDIFKHITGCAPNDIRKQK